MPPETVHMFIRQGVSKDYRENEEALHRICTTLKLDANSGHERAVIAGDDETFRWIITTDRRTLSWARRFFMAREIFTSFYIWQRRCSSVPGRWYRIHCE